MGVPDRDAVEEGVWEGERVLEAEVEMEAVSLKDLPTVPLPPPHTHSPGLPVEEGQGEKEGVADKDALLHPLRV